MLWNLTGYVIGTLVLSPLADRFGRRNMLLVTMVITGLGSLFNGVRHRLHDFVIARIITGIGIGADLAIVNTYIGEVAPRRWPRQVHLADLHHVGARARCWASGWG